MVKSELPAKVDVGVMEVVAGAGFSVAVTVKFSLPDVPPPGAGFTTTTGKVPVAATSLVGIAAISSVDETTVVVTAAPLKSIVDPNMKFVPCTASVKPGLPAGVEVGAIEVTVGTGLFAAVTVNVCAFEVPPPGAGFTTVTAAVPVALTSAARIVTVSVVLEIKVVARGEPFQSTVALETKLEPSTVSVKPELPAAVETGEIEVVIGAGFKTVNVCALEVPPPGAGFTTVIAFVPANVISDAKIVAVSCVGEINTVVLGEPFQSTTDDVTKFVPVTATVKLDPPARVDVGLIEVTVGTGLFAVITVNVSAFEVPPPGAGFTTVTAAVPVALTSAARIVTVSVVLEIKVVARGEPFQSTVALETKLEPSTVMVKSELPAKVDVGVMEVVAGAGFIIVNV
jgi:hypothetical protein